MLEKAGEIFLAFLQRNGMVAMVILTVFAVRLLLRKYPKKYSYWLWAIVGIRMLFDLPVASRFSLFNLFQPFENSTKTIHTLSQQMNSTSVQNQVTAASQTFGTAAGNPSVSLTATPAMNTTAPVLAVLFFVWMTGFGLMLFYGIYSYVKCRKLVRTAVILKKALPICKPQAEKTNVIHPSGRTARVWECDRIPSPFVLGVFRPNIYIPFRMEEQQQQYILAHECCHIRRLDPLWKMLAFVLLAVYWWNPLAWLAFFYMVRDMEMSCDEAVIAFFGNEIKKGYSESLLAFSMERHPYSFAPVAFGEGDAGKRIKHVLKFKKPHTWVAAIAAGLIAIAAVVCLTNRTEFVCGTYSYEHNEESGFVLADFNITFREDGTYEYYEGPLSSYLGFGNFSIKNGILTMKGNVNAGDDTENRFRIKGNRIYFIAKDSDNFTYIKVKDGQSFVLTNPAEEAPSTLAPEPENTERESTPIDAKTEESIHAWAKAFCQRDVKSILNLSTKEAQDDLTKQQLLVNGDFGGSSPWPWGEKSWSGADAAGDTGYMPYSVDTKNQTAEILYYAMESDPHVTVWKETIRYALEDDSFQVTQEELQMYDAIASGWEFDAAYALGINLSPMDYKTNGLGETLNERSVNYGNKNDPLLDPVRSAQYLLNLLDNENKVQLEKVSEGDKVFVKITFPEDGTVRQVKMLQPWGENGIWVPQDDVSAEVPEVIPGE